MSHIGDAVNSILGAVEAGELDAPLADKIIELICAKTTLAQFVSKAMLIG